MTGPHATAQPEVQSPTPATGPAWAGSLLAQADQNNLSAKTRADYTAIYDRFLAWMAAVLDRPPRVEDLTLEVLVAWRKYRERHGGRKGNGLAPASLRVELIALRRLARHASQHSAAARLTVPAQRPRAPMTLMPEEYDKLLRMPDRRSRLGIRDHAILRVLGDTGLRSGELRTLLVQSLVRARDGGPNRSLEIAGDKGNRTRIVPLTAAADDAVEAWLTRHPAAQPIGGGRQRPPDHASLFVLLGRGDEHDRRGQPLTVGALIDLVARHARRAGIPAHLGHPHVLRHSWAARHATLGTPLHLLMELGGWKDPRSVQPYLMLLHVTDADLVSDVERLDADRAARRRQRATSPNTRPSRI
jgi:integrase/recombinase XerD